jgi:nucleoid-associated protein YgaU
MAENWGRGIGALVVLGAIWVLVYWWWEPSRAGGRISFDDSPAPAVRAPAPSPPKPVTPVANTPKPKPTAPNPGGRGTPPIAVIPPAFRPYAVKAGDTWDSVAGREMGSESLALELRKANPYVADLKEGRQLRIPLDPRNIQGRPTGGPSGPAAEPLVVEYTVKRGDTLGAIAKAYYGSTTYKDLIFEANHDRLEREDALKIGQVLRLPPKPN